MRGLTQLFGAAALMLAMAVVPSSCACNETKKGGTTTKPPPADAGPQTPASTACDDQKAKVESLYRAATKPDDKTADESVADNTAMIMTDCRTNPAKFAPCIAAAADVASLERDCVIPLDDEGRVEGKAFGGR